MGDYKADCNCDCNYIIEPVADECMQQSYYISSNQRYPDKGISSFGKSSFKVCGQSPIWRCGKPYRIRCRSIFRWSFDGIDTIIFWGHYDFRNACIYALFKLDYCHCSSNHYATFSVCSTFYCTTYVHDVP